jgi:alpha-beta hydrolase superfamily lysophospholipase
MVNRPSRVDFESTGGQRIAAYRWDPEEAPRAIAQVAHGVGEYALRYQPLVDDLLAAGYVVYSHDHRGHGSTASSPEAFGVLGDDGWPALVADIGRMGEAARDAHPGLPLALIAHSLGSFAAQQWLLDHSEDVTAVVLSGTAAIDLLEPAMNLDEPMDLSAFNAPFDPPRTEFDWLSRDEAQVDAYITDPKCGFGLDIAGGKAMFAGARRVADPAQVARMRKDLPVYVVVGDMDPVNGGLALVTELVRRYEEAGLEHVTLVTYPQARHEVFNETNRDDVVTGTLAWLDRVLPARVMPA